MTRTEETILTALRSNAENKNQGWGDVYLDNAKPAEMSAKSFRSYLSLLSQRGMYRPIDNYAWGEVKLEEGE